MGDREQRAPRKHRHKTRTRRPQNARTSWHDSKKFIVLTMVIIQKSKQATSSGDIKRRACKRADAREKGKFDARVRAEQLGRNSARCSGKKQRSREGKHFETGASRRAAQRVVWLRNQLQLRLRALEVPMKVSCVPDFVGVGQRCHGLHFPVLDSVTLLVRVGLQRALGGRDCSIMATAPVVD